MTKKDQPTKQAAVEQPDSAVNALQETIDSLTASQKVAQVGHWRLDAATGVVTGSDELHRIFGLEQGHLTLEDFAAAVDPEMREWVTGVIADSMKTGSHYDIEHWLILPDGTRRFIRAIGDPALDENGAVTALFGIVQDITARKRNEDRMAIRLRLGECAMNASLDDLFSEVIDALESHTNSTIGFVVLVDEDQRTLTNQGWSSRTLAEYCKAPTGSGHYDIDQAGIWYESIRLRRGLIHNDYPALPGKRGLPSGHAELHREMLAPVFRNDRIVALFGVGNKPTHYEDVDLEEMSSVADLAWDVIERSRLQSELSQREESYRHLALDLHGA